MAVVSIKTVAGTTIGGAISQAVLPMFEVGERVVHPQHGVGKVVRLEDREFERGDIRTYYEIHIPDGTVWVPVDLTNSGLRRLAQKKELAQCRTILQANPSPLMQDGRIRQSALVEHLRQGTLAAQCEVVRDLSAFVAHKPTYGILTSFLESMLRVLCQEWAIVGDTTQAEAMAEISSLLDKRK
ncbi:MAG TPA: CarD family transcriptional regulator [Anaerolineales bacterium]|nr:CarD family transcriptional regulator [Anaerolineales bacterium]